MKSIIVQDKESLANEWLDSYGDALFRHALFKTNDKEAAEDLVQETFLAAFESLPSFKEKSSIKTWLFSILRNKIIDHYRKNLKNLSTEEKNVNSSLNFYSNFFDKNESWKKSIRDSSYNNLKENLLDNPEFNQILKECLNKLPEKWFSAVHLKFLEEKKGELICQELNITPSNFWQILHRAKLQLRFCIEQNWFKP